MGKKKVFRSDARPMMGHEEAPQFDADGKIKPLECLPIDAGVSDTGHWVEVDENNHDLGRAGAYVPGAGHIKHENFDDFIEGSGGSFRIGQSNDTETAKEIKCKKCFGTVFNVGQGSYYTAVRCVKCGIEVGVHFG